MSDLKMRVVDMRWMRAGDIVPHPENWREHGPEQKAAFGAMMESIGFAGALLTFMLPNGEIMMIDGHLRADQHPDEQLPVLVTDLTEDEAREVLATFDPISSLALANKAKIKALHERFNKLRGTRAALLKSMRERQGVVLDGDKPADDPGAQIDRAAQLQEKWQVRKGDIWQIGKHRIMCGDSTCVEDVEMLMDGVKAQLMVTDPPYGVNYDPKWREEYDQFERHSVAPVINDDNYTWFDAFNLFGGAIVYVWCASWYLHHTAADIESAGFDLRRLIIWNKQHFTFGRGHYHWKHESC